MLIDFKVLDVIYIDDNGQHVPAVLLVNVYRYKQTCCTCHTHLKLSNHNLPAHNHNNPPADRHTPISRLELDIEILLPSQTVSWAAWPRCACSNQHPAKTYRQGTHEAVPEVVIVLDNSRLGGDPIPSRAFLRPYPLSVRRHTRGSEACACVCSSQIL